MLNFLVERLLKWVGGKLDGYNTIIGGVVFIIGGLLGIVHQMFPNIEMVIPQNLDSSLQAIGAGWAIIGGARKANKIVDAVKK